MLAPSVVWSPLLLLAGALLAPWQQRAWDPAFDYANLQPSHIEYWDGLGSAEVSLVQALEVAAESEGMPILPLMVELRPGETPVWYLQVYGAADPDKPKRINLQISTSEPKVLRRLELLSLPEDEQRTWEALREAEVPPGIAIQLSQDNVGRFSGGKKEAPIKDPRARTLKFLAKGKPVWHCEVMGIERKLDREEQLRRFEVEVNAKEPKVRRKLILDRFTGEPLRSGEPTELENGMFLYDFKVGDGAVIAVDSNVRVNYRMFLLDGTKIYDTWKDQKEETFRVSAAPLKGMTEGMIGMRVGGRRKIAMPYPKAFGEDGRPELAPPRAMVVCDVQVEGLASE